MINVRQKQHFFKPAKQLFCFLYKHSFTSGFILHLLSSLCFADGAELPRGSLGEAEQGEGPSGPVKSHVVVAGTTQGARHQQGGHQGPRWEGQRTQQPGLAGEGNGARRLRSTTSQSHKTRPQKAEASLAESYTLSFHLQSKRKGKNSLLCLTQWNVCSDALHPLTFTYNWPDFIVKVCVALTNNDGCFE